MEHVVTSRLTTTSSRVSQCGAQLPNSNFPKSQPRRIREKNHFINLATLKGLEFWTWLFLFKYWNLWIPISQDEHVLNKRWSLPPPTIHHHHDHHYTFSHHHHGVFDASDRSCDPSGRDSTDGSLGRHTHQ